MIDSRTLLADGLSMYPQVLAGVKRPSDPCECPPMMNGIPLWQRGTIVFTEEEKKQQAIARQQVSGLVKPKAVRIPYARVLF